MKKILLKIDDGIYVGIIWIVSMLCIVALMRLINIPALDIGDVRLYLDSIILRTANLCMLLTLPVYLLPGGCKVTLRYWTGVFVIVTGQYTCFDVSADFTPVGGAIGVTDTPVSMGEVMAICFSVLTPIVVTIYARLVGDMNIMKSVFLGVFILTSCFGFVS